MRGQTTIQEVIDLQEGRVPPGRFWGDASRGDLAIDPGRVCAWCGGPLPEKRRSDAEVCGVVCRKRRWRWRRASFRVRDEITGGVPPRARDRRDASLGPAGSTARFAYADPPYPGMAMRYPERQEVDHADLIARLEEGWPDGWALSTSARALRDVLPMCPASTRVCVWRRRTRGKTSRRALNAWEALLVVGGRERADRGLDVLDYRGRYDSYPGALEGMKPPEFTVWMFNLLGAQTGDHLADLYPGSGAVSRAWAYLTALEGDVERDASLAATAIGDA